MRSSASYRTALVLQGGGALGAYQAGAVCRLAGSGILPDIVAGISIGAINAALIAGNPPERRQERLATFWNRVTSATAWPGLSAFGAAFALAFGAPGFFRPRLGPVSPWNPGTVGFYDTSPLRETLCELVDFGLLNEGPVRVVLGAVDVALGNFVWFDSAERRIGPEHVMASGALPPGFPPVPIDGAWYWDGGLVSNTPLARVVEIRTDHTPVVIWQVDLFSARGPVPHSLWTVEAREKDIRYSSRTRAVTDHIRHLHDLACALHAHADALPETLRTHPAVAPLLDSPVRGPLTLIHLIYRTKPYETGAKDYDFSREAMIAHWQAGEADVMRCLDHPLFVAHDPAAPGIHVFDLTDGRHLKETLHDGR